MRLADKIVALVIEGRIEEEPVVLDLEVLVLLADPALAEGDELLTLGQGAHRHGPLFEGNRHCLRRSDRENSELVGAGAPQENWLTG